jgi:hypothetical protein
MKTLIALLAWCLLAGAVLAIGVAGALVLWPVAWLVLSRCRSAWWASPSQALFAFLHALADACQARLLGWKPTSVVARDGVIALRTYVASCEWITAPREENGAW